MKRLMLVVISVFLLVLGCVGQDDVPAGNLEVADNPGEVENLDNIDDSYSDVGDGVAESGNLSDFDDGVDDIESGLNMESSDGVLIDDVDSDDIDVDDTDDDGVSSDNDDVVTDVDVDCPDYDSNMAECLKHDICYWVDEEDICEFIDGFEDYDDDYNDDDDDNDDESEWVTFVVDDDGLPGVDCNLAIDSNDVLHASYYEMERGVLKHAYYDGGWVSEVVDDSDGVGEDSSIKVDSLGNIHVSYEDDGERAIKYAFFDGDWHVETIAGVKSLQTSLAVDSKNNPHVSWNDESNHYIRYAYRENGKWNLENVYRTGNDGYDTSIAVDDDDMVHIAFAEEMEDRVRYATKAGGVWDVVVVDPDTVSGQDLEIFADNGLVYIAYRDYGNNRVMLAESDGGSWSVGALPLYVLEDSDCGDYDGDEDGCIDEGCEWYAALEQCTDGGVGGSSSDDDNTGEIGMDLSLFVRDGVVHIAYGDGRAGMVVHAYLDDVWVLEKAGSGGSDVSVVVDSVGDVHIFHVNEEPDRKELLYSSVR